jgi:hypothetical protein
MLDSYIGIVSQRGIELLCPEDPAAMRFLCRRVKREPQRVASFWVVANADVANAMRAAIKARYFQAALVLLHQHARDYGYLLPEEDEVPVAASGTKAWP